MAASLNESAIRAILLDIEGTTTPVDFVYVTLFPYARARAREFLRVHWCDADVREDVAGLRAQHAADTAANLAPPSWTADPHVPGGEIVAAAEYVEWLIDRDSKCSPLKSLQGQMWREGYAKGELQGEVFADVLPAMLRWTRQGKRICIFSSGSVLAQKLLFSTSTAGDLTPFLEAYFDTSIGAKRVAQSYRRIAEALSLPPREIFFISDVTQELAAASDAGMQVALCARGEMPADPGAAQYSLLRNFDTFCP
ncbi:MAG TPA: acireductone synthase [Candidatus Acidoferrales bacterium]|nr:acireductone synthase [Candidatus Acidoferrales bacterium]